VYKKISTQLGKQSAKAYLNVINRHLIQANLHAQPVNNQSSSFFLNVAGFDGSVWNQHNAHSKRNYAITCSRNIDDLTY